jgi:hypothetical protein
MVQVTELIAQAQWIFLISVGLYFLKELDSERTSKQTDKKNK